VVRLVSFEPWWKTFEIVANPGRRTSSAQRSRATHGPLMVNRPFSSVTVTWSPTLTAAPGTGAPAASRRVPANVALLSLAATATEEERENENQDDGDEPLHHVLPFEFAAHLPATLALLGDVHPGRWRNDAPPAPVGRQCLRPSL